MSKTQNQAKDNDYLEKKNQADQEDLMMLFIFKTRSSAFE